MTRSALVTCGEQRAALAVVRSLGRAGFRVSVCATRTPSLAGASRYASAEFGVPDPVARPEAHAQAIERLIERHAPSLLIPVTEAALFNLLPLASRLDPTRIPFPDVDRFSAVCDKTQVFDAARSLGIAVPRERVLEAPVGPDDDLMGEVPFPVVIKPARSVTGTGRQRTRHGVVHAGDLPALRHALDGLSPDAYPLHLQQRIIGPGIGVFLLPWGGELLASFAHRRLREKPPSGGVSVYRESVSLDPELIDMSRRLLDRFDWEGVAMVEYKIDEATGEPFLMEINGRFWGSLELAVTAGVDFPRILADAALGAALEPVTSYRLGVRSRWLWGDIDHLIARLRYSPAQLSLSADAPGRPRAILQFLTAFFAGREEIFQLTDPGPALRETRDWLASVSTRSRAA